MQQDNVKLSVRDIFHMLDNKHGIFLMIACASMEKFKTVLANKDLPQDIRNIISEYADDLKTLDKTANEADVLLSETKPFIYSKLDANEKCFDGDLIRKKTKEPGPLKRTMMQRDNK